MQKTSFRACAWLAVLVLSAAVARSEPAKPTPESVALDMLRNIQENGFNPSPKINGGVGQIALSLLHAYIVTNQQAYLDRANDLLGPLTAEKNPLGLWDVKHGGYFAGVEFDGPDFKDPGKPKLLDTTKECGRQFHMLQAFHVADRLTNGKYKDMEEAMLHVLLEKAYYAPGRGLFYEAEPDWSPRKMKNGALGDWVTTEAMGCTLMALFSLDEEEPW